MAIGVLTSGMASVVVVSDLEGHHRGGWSRRLSATRYVKCASSPRPSEVTDRQQGDAPSSLPWLDGYLVGIEEDWPEADIYRLIVCGLPRNFHVLPAAEQRAALAGRPPLTGTKWDALLAATVEHVARQHGHDAPAWVDEPERFLDSTWVVSSSPWIRANALMYSPAAFLRHGAIPDPRDLDGRGGERHQWTPWPSLF